MASDPHPTKKRRSSMCVGCGGQIQDQYILRVAPDLEWHARCLKCADCCQFLDESCTCFVRDGKTYCKRDYFRLFGAKCAKCYIGFDKNDFVMRARNKIFHIDCFRCVACSRQLIPGDEFALREDGLFCKADHDVVERAGSREKIDGSPVNNNNNGENKHALQLAGLAEQVSDREREQRPREKTRKEQKTTRVRTVLNEKQLHTLRTCYNANPRPDALMKEQLVEMTSLSPRVIRVWFQNKRCKDKKRQIALKAMQEQQEKSWYPKYPGVLDLSPNSAQDHQNGSRHPLQGGVPMVASSPVRHDTTMQANHVEVQSYQPPWQALNDFAMKSEIEQPPFQQLVSSFVETSDDDDAVVTI